jgi:hypothetical protein
MPVYNDYSPKPKHQIVPKEITKQELEQTDDFKYFMANLGKPVELLQPLELQR